MSAMCQMKNILAHVVEKESLFPYGLTGFLAGFQIAVFAFVGIELVGTTAAETKDPHHSHEFDKEIRQKSATTMGESQCANRNDSAVLELSYH